MFQVELKKSAKKELDNCPPEYKSKIIEAMKFLQQEPYPFKFYDVRKVRDEKIFMGSELENTDSSTRFLSKRSLF
jgi:mRNA-degrading endonuclease RelE of RelBE toxin-antitoxin system